MNNRFIKRTLSFFMIASLVVGSLAINSRTASAEGLSDISKHWGKENIEKLIALGGIIGYEDGTFKPDASISNQELMSILINTLEKDSMAKASSTKNWAEPVFAVAYSKGIVTQAEMPRESWGNPMNRNDMAMVLERTREILLKEGTVNVLQANKYIKDYSSLKSDRKIYIEQAFMTGLLAGDLEGDFNGEDSLKRAEAATIAMRLIDSKTRVIPKEIGILNEQENSVVNTNFNQFSGAPKEAIALIINLPKPQQIKLLNVSKTLSLQETGEKIIFIPRYAHHSIEISSFEENNKIYSNLDCQKDFSLELQVMRPEGIPSYKICITTQDGIKKEYIIQADGKNGNANIEYVLK